MLIDKAEIERVKRANELVAFIRSRGVALTQRGGKKTGVRPAIFAIWHLNSPGSRVSASLPQQT